jgi:hypothetical protein
MARKGRGPWWKQSATSVAPSAPVSVQTSITVSEAVSVAPTPTSSGDSVTIFRGSQAEFLRDEVMVDHELDTHASIIWASDMSSLAALVGGENTGPADMYLQQASWPTDYGHAGVELYPEPTFGRKSYRSPSAYAPDHYISSTGTPNRNYGTSGDGQSFINLRKWTRNGVSSSPSNGVHTPIGTAAITEMYCRMGVYLESDILTGMDPNLIGLKLGGVLGGSAGLMWFRREISGAGRWQLHYYSNNGDIRDWYGGHPSD